MSHDTQMHLLMLFGSFGKALFALNICKINTARGWAHRLNCWSQQETSPLQLSWQSPYQAHQCQSMVQRIGGHQTNSPKKQVAAEAAIYWLVFLENLYSFIKEGHYRNNKSAQNNRENYFVDHFFLLGSDYNLRLAMNKSSAWKPSSNKYIAAVTSNQVQIKLYLLVGSKHAAAIRTWTAALNTSSRCRNGNKASAQ